MAPVEIKAAGGVVVRWHRKKGQQVLAIRRARYQDWSLPKGKLNPREKWVEAAIREVFEETGMRCRLGPELKPTRYRVGKERRPKLVRWWLMTEPEGRFEPNNEVDRIKWMKPAKAARKLVYAGDRRLVRDAIALLEAPDQDKSRRRAD